MQSLYMGSTSTIEWEYGPELDMPCFRYRSRSGAKTVQDGASSSDGQGGFRLGSYATPRKQPTAVWTARRSYQSKQIAPAHPCASNSGGTETISWLLPWIVTIHRRTRPHSPRGNGCATRGVRNQRGASPKPRWDGSARCSITSNRGAVALGSSQVTLQLGRRLRSTSTSFQNRTIHTPQVELRLCSFR